MVLLTIFYFLDFNCAEKFSLVSQASDAGLVREDVVIQAIALVLARVLIHCHSSKYNFVSSLFVVLPIVLTIYLDFVLTKLFDDFLN